MAELIVAMVVLIILVYVSVHVGRDHRASKRRIK